MLVNHVVPASVFVIAVVQGVTPCPCQACTTADPNAPLFFVGANHDGAGSTVLAMIQASAYAARRGWNFGGALGPVQSNFGNKVWADSTARPGVPLTAHARTSAPSQASTSEVIAFVFGDASMHAESLPRAYHARLVHKRLDATARPLSLVWQPPANTSTPLETIEAVHPRPSAKRRASNGMFAGWDSLGDAVQLIKVMSPSFLAALRAGNDCARNAFPLAYERQAGVPTVAVHFRRPLPAAPELQHRREFPNATYFEAILDAIPAPSEIHIFTNPLTAPGADEAEDLALLARWGMVHANGTLVSDWAHMIAADVFIGSVSAFSVVPAILNSRCVVLPRKTLDRWSLDGWMDGDSGLSATLPACLARILR